MSELQKEAIVENHKVKMRRHLKLNYIANSRFNNGEKLSTYLSGYLNVNPLSIVKATEIRTNLGFLYSRYNGVYIYALREASEIIKKSENIEAAQKEIRSKIDKLANTIMAKADI